MEKGNMVVDQGVITLTSPLEKMRFLTCTGAYFLYGFAHYWADFMRAGRGWDLAIFVVLTVLWLYLIAGLRSTTWFTPGEPLIRRRNLLYYTRDILCDAVGNIGQVENSRSFYAEGMVYFALVRKSNPLAKGYRITGNLRPDGAEYAFFVSEVLPAVNQIVFGDAMGPAPEAAEREAGENAAAGLPPERMRQFKRKGNLFYRWRLPLIALMGPVGVVMLVGAAVETMSGEGEFSTIAILAVMGLLATMGGGREAFRIGVDVDRGDLVLSRCYGLLHERVPVTPAIQVLAQRNYNHFVFLGTTLLLRYPDAGGGMEEQTLGFCHIFRKGFLELEREMKILLATALAKRQ